VSPQRKPETHNQEIMNHLFKLIASRGSEIVFDDRIQAANPREARKRLKEQLGIGSLSGIVYSITEIPVDLIREIVDARIAELTRGSGMPEMVSIGDISSEDAPDGDSTTEPEEPNWGLIRRHFRRYGEPSRTAERYGIDLESLQTRANEEGWAS
jgi:hypothetical protein